MQDHLDDPISMPVLSLVLPVVESRLHGRQHYISQSIVRLRRCGLLVDVADRCPYCGRAGRPQEEVLLSLTEYGRNFNPEDEMPAIPLEQQIKLAEQAIFRLRVQLDREQQNKAQD